MKEDIEKMKRTLKIIKSFLAGIEERTEYIRARINSLEKIVKKLEKEVKGE